MSSSASAMLNILNIRQYVTSSIYGLVHTWFYLHSVHGVQDPLLDFRCGTSHEGDQALVDLALIFRVSVRQGLQEQTCCLLRFICA